MYQDLQSKTVLVTGASVSTGIGFGIAETLASSGMDIILADLPPVEGLHTQRPIDVCCAHLEKTYGVRSLALDLDVTNPEHIAAASTKIRAFTPVLHGLVNNAGCNMGASKVGDYDPSLWKKIININLFGPFALIQAFLPLMICGSSIVNIASRAGKRPLPTCSAYSVSKAALIMLTKCIAVEYGSSGIRANALCPGQILTDMNKRRYAREAAAWGCTPEESMQKAIATVPLGRIGTPQDVGQAAAFLLSTASSYLTGQAINVTGGQITEL